MRCRELFLAFSLISVIGFAADPKRPFVVGHLADPLISESSGIVESRKHPGIYWTHNDSGNEPMIYAIRRDGSSVNRFAFRGIARDWEDIAADDEGHLYLADIGNNGNRFAAISITMIDEPDPALAPQPNERVAPRKQWLITFPHDQRMDCESFFVWKGDGYLLNKSSNGVATSLWKISLGETRAQSLEHVATLPIDAICTGADLSIDGDRLAVMSIGGVYLFEGLKGDLNAIGTSTPKWISIERKTSEAICISEDGCVGTNEQRDVYFFPWDAFKALPQK